METETGRQQLGASDVDTPEMKAPPLVSPMHGNSGRLQALGRPEPEASCCPKRGVVNGSNQCDKQLMLLVGAVPQAKEPVDKQDWQFCPKDLIWREKSFFWGATSPGSEADLHIELLVHGISWGYACDPEKQPWQDESTRPFSDLSNALRFLQDRLTYLTFSRKKLKAVDICW